MDIIYHIKECLLSVNEIANLILDYFMFRNNLAVLIEIKNKKERKLRQIPYKDLIFIDQKVVVQALDSVHSVCMESICHIDPILVVPTNGQLFGWKRQ